MSSGPPPAAAMMRRTLPNMLRHCASRSAGTLPVSGSAPEIAPETTNGPFLLALGIGLRCLTPPTSMLRRFSIARLPPPSSKVAILGRQSWGGNTCAPAAFALFRAIAVLLQNARERRVQFIFHGRQSLLRSCERLGRRLRHQFEC